MCSFLAPIQMMLRDVLHDSVGNEVPHRLIVLHAFATGGRRDREGGYLQLADVVAREAVGAQNVSWAGDRDEVGQLPQLIMVPPTENLRYGVGSGDEEEL